MTNKETQIEIAAVSAIIADTIFKKAYDFFNNNGMGGYVFTTYEIAGWAVEFERTHRNTNWEDVLHEGNFKPQSNFFKNSILTTINGKDDTRGPLQVICWDDAVMDFAHHKFEEAVAKHS